MIVAPCSHDAARYAVEHWHYSRTMPAGKLVRYGVWEHEQFIGCILFGRGATYRLGRPYGLDQTEVCELVRVALREHDAPVSAALGPALADLRSTNPGLRLVISFADPQHGHHGGIYQATNWIYLGRGESFAFRVRGQLVHPRTLYARYGVGGQSIPWLREHVDPNAERVVHESKHRYGYPLDRAMRRRLRRLAEQYPPAVERNGCDDPSRVGGRVRSPDTARHKEQQ